MGAPRVYKTEAVILRRTNLGEADKILTIFTPRLGKIRAIAKAIRRPSAKLSGHLDLFSRTELMVARGTNLDVVTGAQMVQGYRTIRDDLWLSTCAMYVLEWIDRFTIDDAENVGLYSLLIQTLEALDSNRNSEMTLRHFELRGLDLAGYRPNLRSCVVCDSPIEPEANHYGPDGVTCPNCIPGPSSYPISLEALKVLRYLQSHDLIAAMRLRPDQRVGREVDIHLRRTIRSILERELKSTEFLDLIRRIEQERVKPAEAAAGL
jgi:DNA repair protein RecO (recombination protein O)